ncbi:MAG TPA: Cys-tRNA(Pro) deacylase [Kribbellaceae bacterium]|jgi:Cys-tRNA(Pro)/Cys-tRNA(Cys) deacylase
MARAKQSAPGTPATLALRKAGIVFVAHEYAHDPSSASYGLEAAEALGVEPGRVFKTLLVDTGAGLAVGVVPVDRQLDLKAVAGALGVKKVAMAQPADAERSTGYVVGGISPVGQKKALPTVLDATASGHATILVSGGRRGLDLELAPADLTRITRATIAPISR